jgi:GntR family transcriptional regulator
MATKRGKLTGSAPINDSADSSAKSLYSSIAQTLRQELVRGVYPVGTSLPTEAELSERFAVSRQTVRGALRLLRDERLVTTRQGAGTVVAPPSAADLFTLDAPSIDDLLAYASQTHTEVLSTKMEIVKGKLASRIGVPSGAQWLVVLGLAVGDNSELPISWAEYYINREFAGVSRLLQRHSGPLVLLIEDMFALRHVSIDQEISATLMSPAVATALQAKDPMEPAIQIRRTFRMADESIIQISVHTHPASRFRHTMRIRRN